MGAAYVEFEWEAKAKKIRRMKVRLKLNKEGDRRESANGVYKDDKCEGNGKEVHGRDAYDEQRIQG
ncbi:hypothetical protein FACS189472_15180 [Alphaproteobacteria bacterium]|nr:hypothetical protein FACS189472_15180 [Alphaproteobacteria bacterium]